MSDSDTKEIQEYSDGFKWVRRLLYWSSCLVFSYEVIGLGFKGEIPILDISLRDPSLAIHALALVTVGLMVLAFIRWKRQANYIRHDYWSIAEFILMMGFSSTSVIIYATTKLLNTPVYEFIWWWIPLFSYGIVTGIIYSISIDFSLIRTKEKALRLGLPRVPVAVKSMWIFSIVFTIPLVIFIAIKSYVAPPIVVEYWYISFLFPFLSIFTVLRITASNYDLDLQEAFDTHDAWYGVGTHDPSVAGKENSLFTAAENGNLDKVKKHLYEGADPELELQSGWTALNIATANGHKQIVEYLLGQGADPNHSNLRGRTPLMFACRYGRMDIAKILIESGAEVEPDTQTIYEDKAYDNTPLMAAVLSGNKELVQLLLKKGADPKKENHEGDTAIDIAHDRQEGRIASIIRRHMRDNSKWEDPPTEWKDIIEKGSVNEIKKLLESGFDVNEKSPFSVYPLMVAARHREAKIVRLLIDAGADVNVKGEANQSPLMYAARFNEDPEVVEVLIKSGAKLEIKDRRGMNALHYAATFNTVSEVVEVLLEMGADPNARGNDGETALINAASKNDNRQILKTLVDGGADINARTDTGTTALMLGSKFNQNPEIVSYLIDEGANVNSKNNFGVTALMLAAASNPKNEITAKLIELGAEVNTQDQKGRTALMRAAAFNSNPDILKHLLNSNADPSIQDEDGKTAMDFIDSNTALKGTDAYDKLKSKSSN